MKENEKWDKYVELAIERKTMEYEGELILIVIGTFGTVAKGLVKGLEDLDEEWRPSRLQDC